MAVYYVTPYFLKSDKVAAFRDWLKSDKAKKSIKAFEKETGVKYIGTFFSVLGFGNADAEDWWEMKNYESFDKLRESKSWTAMFNEVFPFIDTTHSTTARLYRSADDVKVFEPPKTKQK